jgi:hypothetical protein
MRLDVRGQVSGGVQSRVRALVAAQRTLEDVVNWGLSQTPLVVVSDVVVQDEYTHDVVIAHPSGVWLVYDTT